MIHHGDSDSDADGEMMAPEGERMFLPLGGGKMAHHGDGKSAPPYAVDTVCCHRGHVQMFPLHTAGYKENNADHCLGSEDFENSAALVYENRNLENCFLAFGNYIQSLEGMWNIQESLAFRSRQSPGSRGCLPEGYEEYLEMTVVYTAQMKKVYLDGHLSMQCPENWECCYQVWEAV